MAGNLDYRGSFSPKDPLSNITIITKISSATEFVKKWGYTIGLWFISIMVGLQYAETYLKTNDGKPLNIDPPAVVAPVEPVAVPQKFQMEAKKNTDNSILEANKPSPSHSYGIAARFNDDNIRAELVIPDKPVDVYKLVRIKTTEDAKFFDLFVMTINNNKLIFIDSVPTSNKGEWVFTGPPGEYSIRLSAYNPDTGVKVTVGNMTIGEPVPPPPPPKPPVAKVNVPNFVGNQFGDSQSLATALGLVLKTSNPDLKGIVTAQDITASTSVDIGSTVTVVVKSAPTPPPAFTEKYGFSTFSYNEVLTKVDADARAAYKDKLASNFEAVAAKIAAGAYSGVQNPIASSQADLAAMNRMTLNNNDPATVQKWVAFYSDWAARATAMNHDANNPLPNLVSEYGVVYLESAKGLRAAQ